jgi:4,5-DOPA dioxygenase extradiol
MDKLASLNLIPSPLMPVLFVGHGNPMHVLSNNVFTQEWQRIGMTLPNAQAIVVISAHWMTHGTHVTDAPKQPLIYDFYGFPDDMYQVQYQADGSPALAHALQQELLRYEAVLDSTWGLDHGTWTVLKHLAPHPKVPILQISIDMNKSLADQYDVFSALKAFRQKGVVFIGSGNIVHNLQMADFAGSHTYDWALEFDAISKDIIERHEVVNLTNPFRRYSSAKLAIPTDDHYRPLLASMALLNESETVSFFNESIDLGSVSMRSFISA